MNIDWTKATIRVTAPVQHTAMATAQEFEIPVADFAAWVFDAYSARVRGKMAKDAVARRAVHPVPPAEGEK